MALSVTAAMTGGIRRAANRNGLLLSLALVAVGAVWQLSFYSAIATAVQLPGASAQSVPLPTIDLPLAVSATGAVVALIGLQYVTVVTMRTLVGGRSGTIPSEYYTRNIVPVLANAIVGGILYGLAVLVGSVLLVVPGIIAYVALSFTLLYIATEDQNAVAALASSWHTTRGHWLRLFLLLTVVFGLLGLTQGVLSFLAQAAFAAASGGSLGVLASGVIVLPLSVVVIGILADAFVQLNGPDASSH